MPTQRVPMAEWLPDQNSIIAPGSDNIFNVFPVLRGYKPINQLAAVSSNAMADGSRGATSARDSSQSVNTFFGSISKLYKYAAGVLSDVSKAGGYSLAIDSYWEFCQFGQRIIASTIDQAPQYWDMGSSSAFANLTGSPPAARHIATIRDFVVLGNTATSPNEVRWSAFNDSTGWTAGTNQSDAQTLFDGGWVQAVVGGDVGWVFQEYNITRMTYVGTPLVFQFDVVETGRGTPAGYSVVRVGAKIYFRGQDGFYAFDTGTGVSTPIGTERIDRWFLSNVNQPYLYRMRGAQDFKNKIIYWSFVSTQATDPTHPDMVLVYNWEVDRWAYAKFDHEIIYPGQTEAWTLESLSAVYSNLDTSVPVSFDSAYWAGGVIQLRAVNTSHYVATFDGTPLAAILESQEFEGQDYTRSLVTNCRPLTDAVVGTVADGYRERIGDPVVYGMENSMSYRGDCPLTQSAGYHRLRFSVPLGSTWSFLEAMDIEVQPDGEL